ncbi:MAG: ABC transporter ATP-binding protein [Halobacteriovoraceae bacterium]|nr:ABC transporter ATP-binding protein [Halobacteriovoraceae bacterium]
MLITDLMQVLVTRNLGWILDFFSGGKLPSWFQNFSKQETFHILFFILVGSRLLAFISRWGWRVTLARNTHFAGAMLKGKIWDNVRFFKQVDLNKTYSKGILMSASTSDVQQGRFVFGFTLVGLVDVIFLGTFTMATMLTIHIPMTFWSLGVLLFLPFWIRKLSDKEMTLYRKAQEGLGIFNDLGSQVVQTIRLQRITQTGKFWSKKLLEEAETYRQKRLSGVKTSLLYIPTLGGASIVSYIVLFTIGLNYTMAGEISIGDFIALQGLIFLLQDPLFELGFIISDFKKGFTSLERLNKIYENPKEESLLIKSEREIKNEEKVLEISNLTFCYPGNSRKILSDFSLTLVKGQRLGLFGAIGSGKSTLVNIMAGIERSYQGEVLFHGLNFNKYSHATLRRYIGHVPQKPFLFAESIKSNVSMDQNLTETEVWHFLEMSGLKKDVLDFPDQLETPLGEWGINLSGGQKQRLTLARALARRPKILFLDDCLSAVDTVTEESILNNLDRELKEVTLVWVAHRSSTLKYCDRILELDEGKIV